MHSITVTNPIDKINYTKKNILQRIFNIYPGEEHNAWLFASLGFVWALGAASGLKFADALFLIHVGAKSLPIAYALTSCGMMIIACILLYMFHHFLPRSIYEITLILGIIFYVAVFLWHFMEYNMESVWFWYTLKVIGFFLFTILMTCYWTFIDQYYHLQDAKRLYSLFSASVFLGIASTGLLMHSGILDLPHLILVIIGLLILTCFRVKKIGDNITPVGHEDQDHQERGHEHGKYVTFLLLSIFNSPFTLLLMATNFLSYLLLVITEYNYMFTFENYFASLPNANNGEGTEAQLTLFLGQYLGITGAANLLFGVFIYSRLVRRFGVTNLLVISPLLLIIAFSGWSISTSFIFPLIGFFVVEGTLYVVDDNNFNLLLNAVPARLKYKIRVIIESFFEPIGMLISALLLSFFQNSSKLLGLILAICGLATALALRSRYLQALFFNLSDNVIPFQRTTEEWIAKISDKQKKVCENRLFEILKLGDEDAQLFACEGLLAFDDHKILKQLLQYAQHMKASIKIKLIVLFEHSSFAKHILVLDCLRHWMQSDFDISLKSVVHFYLAKQGLIHPEKVITDLKSSDIQIHGAAIIALKNSWAHVTPSAAAFNHTLVSQHLALLLDSKCEEELCMGLYILGIDATTHDVDIFISHLRNPSLRVARTAAHAMAKSHDMDPIHQAPFVIEQLKYISDHEIRLACLDALGRVNDATLVREIINASFHFRPSERRLTEKMIYRIGLRTVPILLSILRDLQLPDRCRLLAGRVLGRLALPQLHANLTEIIRQEIERAYLYFYHCHTIQMLHPELDLSTLKEVLMTGYHSVLDFIIQLLGVAGEVEDEELLSRSLRSPNPKLRSQVVEALEKTCETPIFRLLQPLIDDIPDDEKIRAYLKLGHKPLILNTLLDMMSESSAQMDHIIAAVMKYNLNFPNWRQSLRQQMSQQDEIFQHFAYELLEL